MQAQAKHHGLAWRRGSGAFAEAGGLAFRDPRNFPDPLSRRVAQAACQGRNKLLKCRNTAGNDKTTSEKLQLTIPGMQPGPF